LTERDGAKENGKVVNKTECFLEGHTMMNFIKNFRADEDGAVTVDWVVLTAAVVGLAIAAYASIETGASNLTSSTSTFMATQNPGGSE
jgi:Flp pilus assembly pilin Flp